MTRKTAHTAVHALLLMALACIVTGLSAAPADAEFGILTVGGSAKATTGAFDGQAGGHPDFTTSFNINVRDNGDGSMGPDGNLKDVRFDLPPGLIGNPEGAGRCQAEDLATESGYPACPIDSQVGVTFTRSNGDLESGLATVPLDGSFGVYNMVPPRGVPARLAFIFERVVINIDANVDPSRGYAISATSLNTAQSLAANGATVTLWGVPADPVHDAYRFDKGGNRPTSSGAQLAPFMTAPTECSGDPLRTALLVSSWDAPDVFATASFDHDFDGFALRTEGCGRLEFSPALAIQPSTTDPDTPAGLKAEIDSPQNLSNPTGLATAHLKDVTVTLPEGMTINPGSADGLQACSDAQLGLGSNAAVSCPDGAKIGTATATTPLLEEDLTGGVYIRSQASDDPESGQMFRMALVLENAARGIRVKLPGEIRVNRDTGRIVTEFANNPQMPVEHVGLHLKAGPRAPLATPSTCGTKSIGTALASWAGHDRSVPTSFDVACTPGLGSFAPSFSSGTGSPIAGASSPFALQVSKPDGHSDLNGVALSLPEGLLASLKGNIGTRIGTARVAAGPGSNPFWLSGPVVLEGAYGDAPFSLRVTVPAVAGPFNLGDVVVRQKIYVDPHDAHATVVSDPLPTIVKGVPVRLQHLTVDIDKPGFMLNPTSCAATEVKGTLSSVAGQTAQVANRFQVGECAGLGYTPKLAMTMSGKGQTKDGSHPALTARLTPPAGNANNKKVTVTLPLSLALDPGNANGLCEPADAAKNQCPAASIVGSAQAQSILPDTLKAPVYFVRGERLDSKGKVRKTLPKLFLPLSANGVTVNVWGDSDVKDERLVTTFNDLPDAPFTSFDLNINGGKHGILAVSGANTCAATQIADAEFGGQNGKAYTSKVTMGTPCALGVVKSSHTATALKLTVGGLGAGKVSASGNGVAKASKSLTSATTATLTLKLAKATRRALARGRDVKVKVKVAFTAKGQKKAKTATKTLVIHGTKKR